MRVGQSKYTINSKTADLLLYPRFLKCSCDGTLSRDKLANRFTPLPIYFVYNSLFARHARIMETCIRLPLGNIPQHPPIPLPEDVDSNWTPLEKALETYGLTVMHCTSHAIQNDEDDDLETHWEASKYNVGNPPDKTIIPIKSPFRPGLTEAKIQQVIETIRKFLRIDPPEEYLNLLRLTNGVWGDGKYEADNCDRRETEPFSPWDLVAWRRKEMMNSKLTEKGIPE
jgi:hypothetical protein